MSQANILLPGFAEPVAQSQNCFRAVLDAMARPGRIMRVPKLAAPSPLDAATAAVLLSLLDADTPTWLDSACAAVVGWLAFHCGAPLAERGRAAFAVACEMPPLATLLAGTDLAPETAATLVLQVAELGRGASYTLTGPGVRGSATLQVHGLPSDFTDQWRANHSLFPRGVDIILCADAQIAALPRSVEVT